MEMRVGQGFDGFVCIQPRASMPLGFDRKRKNGVSRLLTNACRIRRPSMGEWGVSFEEMQA